MATKITQFQVTDDGWLYVLNDAGKMARRQFWDGSKWEEVESPVEVFKPKQVTAGKQRIYDGVLPDEIKQPDDEGTKNKAILEGSSE